MAFYKITLGAQITIYQDDTMMIRADNKEQAIAQAEANFKEHLNNFYGWCDYDEVKVESIKEID